ncbi:4-galactosyl-N-acetylglucosaminide 3-alpha-L-fucosyltransferase 9-like isoform X1 [Alosa pseudoharengus]|uniref:4-galactosyl-N-acetylglucosaminide 3-alpha-L-fucosyltransferase 9-like isoform X1 n=2 Tax=Alosa pseudoharengus TaxID=34774 RepID=UPI003F8A6DD9
MGGPDSHTQPQSLICVMAATGTHQKVLISLLIFLFIFVVYKRNNTLAPQTPQVVHIAKENNTNENYTILLIWFWPFKKKFDLNSCASKYHINGCHLTDDRNLYSKADGVLIHHRDIYDNLSNLPNLPRPFFQKWIWMLFESPQNSKRIQGLDNLFNVTMNYRRDADITVREQLQCNTKETEEPIPVKNKKTKIVCWIVSNWNENHARVKYYNILKEHIEVETFGRHFNRVLSNEGYTQTIENCKFYLSFENTLKSSDHTAIDYMTEKLYSPLRLGTVPVVLGPPRDSYERFIPRDAFIHVDDFSSPKELADYLLGINETEYHQFFNWRKHFTMTGVNFAEEHACRACQYIRERKSFQVFTNLNKWYWG